MLTFFMIMGNPLKHGKTSMTYTTYTFCSQLCVKRLFAKIQYSYKTYSLPYAYQFLEAQIYSKYNSLLTSTII